jgi:hypothetical protein
METFYSISPLIAVLVPVLAVFLILFSHRWPNIREFWTIIASVSMFGVIFSMLPSCWTIGIGNIHDQHFTRHIDGAAG